MVNRYEQVHLWQSTLAKQLMPDVFEKERDLLRVGFDNFRSRAKSLSAEIDRDLPEFTVHDITHIDALWETANMVLGDENTLNPAEAFVLGGAFLIHDLGMGLAAYPNGIEELKKEPIWIDSVSAAFKKKYNRQINKKDFDNLDSQIERIALSKVLRLLHAKQAEKLGQIKWKDKNGNHQYLIEKTELRESYGNIIGLIAHSHWWSVDELEKKLPPKLGAPRIFPSEWTVDPTKLACVLRIADAVQIDDGRAPTFLKTIRNPSSHSEVHWNFQAKLYQPRIERNRIIFSSKSPFKITEVDSWWLCFDTLKMIDKELREVDSLLTDTNRGRLKALGVASIEDPQRLSKLITVENWKPVDTKIKVSNVAKLVSNLGGKELYGDDLLVPIRELLQNSSDAIRARRLLEEENENFGTINFKFGKDKKGEFIEISDNGVGMSSKILTGPFLDFGESFWGTAFMHEELPGLESKGFSSTGKYGIGFFSVFMLGDSVSVTSKRFEDARTNSLTLEFNNGITSRPILRPSKKEEIIKDGGTRVRIWVRNNSMDKILYLRRRKMEKISLTEFIETLCPSIDCNIDITEEGRTKRVIKSNDWLSISSIDLIKRILGYSNYAGLSKEDKKFAKTLAANMEIIWDEDNRPIARGFIFKSNAQRKKGHPFFHSGLVTLGGLRSCEITGLIGVFKGRPARASRDIGIPLISADKLKAWATSQAKLLHKLDLDFETQIECSSIIRVCEGNTGDLKVAFHKTGPLNYNEMKSVISTSNSDKYLIVQDAAVRNYERKHKCKIKMKSNVIWVSVGTPGILQTRSINSFFWWPENSAIFGNEESFSLSLEGLTTQALCEHWNCTIEEIYSSSKISADENSISAVVGTCNGKNVIIDHLDIMKKPI